MIMYKKFLSWIDSTNEWIGKIFSILIIILVGEIFVGVIARYIFDSPFLWTQEVACFITAMYILMSGGYALRHKNHVRVDFFFNTFSPRGKAIADLFTSLLFFYFSFLLVWQGGDMALSSITAQEVLAGAWRGPIYPFKIFIPIGATLLLLQGIVKFIRDLSVARTGKEEEDTL